MAVMKVAKQKCCICGADSTRTQVWTGLPFCQKKRCWSEFAAGKTKRAKSALARCER